MHYFFFLFLSLCCATRLSAGDGPVHYQVQGESFEGYYLSAGAHAPLILLVHDWDGVTAYEIKRSEMLRELGYSVFALDLYGTGVRPKSVDEKKKLTTALYNNRSRMRTLLLGGVEAAKKQGGNLNKSVAMGYCFGGAAVLELARSGAADFKGYVSFHGGLETPKGQNYAASKGNILIFHGTADTSVSMEQFATLADTLEKQGVAHEMITYSGAPHAFTVFGTDRYRVDADTKSWKRFIDYLQQTLR